MIERVTKSKIFKHFLDRPLTVTAGCVLFILFVGAVFAPLLAPQNPII